MLDKSVSVMHRHISLLPQTFFHTDDHSISGRIYINLLGFTYLNGQFYENILCGTLVYKDFSKLLSMILRSVGAARLYCVLPVGVSGTEIETDTYLTDIIHHPLETDQR